MKLVMTLLVRDEEDILKANIEYHLAQGVDFIIATDNLSVDGTRDILESYQRQGVLHYIHESRDNYNQHEWVTRMARMASTEFEANWVINNDADEFWWPRQGNLKSTFLLLPPDINCVRAQRTNFVYVSEDDSPSDFYHRMLHREVKSFNALGHPLPPKVAHKGTESVIVHQGNHDVGGIDNKQYINDVIDIFHYPIRSKEQLLRKIVSGGAAYERNTELAPQVGGTWRNLYRDFKEYGNLDVYLDNEMYTSSKIAEEVAAGKLVKDERLQKFIVGLGVGKR